MPGASIDASARRALIVDDDPLALALVAALCAGAERLFREGVV